MNSKQNALSNGSIGHTGQKSWIFYLFRTLNETREFTERWLTEYHSEGPHNLTPEEYRLMAENPKISKSMRY